MILVFVMLTAGLLSTIGCILDRNGRYRFQALSYMFYGSCLMWSVDLAAGLLEEGIGSLALTGEEALDDLLLSGSATLLALMVWSVMLLTQRIRQSRAPVAA